MIPKDVCYHEAGHAVVDFVLGIQLEKILLDFDGVDVLGGCFPLKSSIESVDPGHRFAAWHAGPIAQYQYDAESIDRSSGDILDGNVYMKELIDKCATQFGNPEDIRDNCWPLRTFSSCVCDRQS